MKKASKLYQQWDPNFVITNVHIHTTYTQQEKPVWEVTKMPTIVIPRW